MNEKAREIVRILCSEELDNYDTNDILVGVTFFITGILRNMEGFNTPFATTYVELHDAIEKVIEEGIVNENDEQQ